MSTYILRRILQLVLQLEYTQVAFYEEALQKAGLRGALRDFAMTALGHERQHLDAIRRALGPRRGIDSHLAKRRKISGPTPRAVCVLLTRLRVLLMLLRVICRSVGC